MHVMSCDMFVMSCDMFVMSCDMFVMSCDMFVMSCAINSQREEVYNLLFFDVCVYLIHNPSPFLLSVIII